MWMDETETEALRRLQTLVGGTRRPRLSRMAREDTRDLFDLYRLGSSVLARMESTGSSGSEAQSLRSLLGRAHGLLYGKNLRYEGHLARRLWRFYMRDCPRALRAEWRLLSTGALLMYGLAVAAFFAVQRDLELAYSLLDPAMVSSEIEQLRATAADESFRGNFTFGQDKSSQISGWLMAHNIGVSVLFFGSGLFPPAFFYILSSNGLMLGTYTGVASHWGQAEEISSILWCHGVLELQAIVLAGCAGLVLLRGLVAPGPWTRSHALSIEGPKAGRLMAVVVPMLVTAGMIEGFISPHAGFRVRITVAVVTGVALLTWALLAGREKSGKPSSA